MDRYKVIKQVGNGTFGTVWRAINKLTGEVVAIKKMKKKYYSWEECMNLREVKSLRKMNHRNIVKLKEIIREHDILYFVFEFMEFNLFQLMKDREKPFSEAEIRNWCFQIFHALAYTHQRGYFHRDLKPENLLVTKDVIKVADFGLAREVHSEPPFTEYVSTRWYRAPEVLLQSPVYDSAVDMWAMGAIMAELFTLHPLFPGSSEADEIYKICRVMGCPTKNSWSRGLQLANSIKYQFPQFASAPLSALIPAASEDAISLISVLCSWDPCKRPTAVAALQHSFFQPCHYVPPPVGTRMTSMHRTPSVGMKGALEPRNSRRYSTGALSNSSVLQSNSVGGLSGSKPAGLSSMKMSASLRTGVQRKLEMDFQEAEKNEKSKTCLKQPPCRPPARNRTGPVNSGRPTHRVSDAAEKLAQMALGSPTGRQRRTTTTTTTTTTGQPPPAMKAGYWHTQSAFLGQSNEIPSARSLFESCRLKRSVSCRSGAR